MEVEDIKLYLESKGVKYISHKEHEDGESLIITFENVLRIDKRGMEYELETIKKNKK